MKHRALQQKRALQHRALEHRAVHHRTRAVRRWCPSANKTGQPPTHAWTSAGRRSHGPSELADSRRPGKKCSPFALGWSVANAAAAIRAQRRRRLAVARGVPLRAQADRRRRGLGPRDACDLRHVVLQAERARLAGAKAEAPMQPTCTQHAPTPSLGTLCNPLSWFTPSQFCPCSIETVQRLNRYAPTSHRTDTLTHLLRATH